MIGLLTLLKNPVPAKIVRDKWWQLSTGSTNKTVWDSSGCSSTANPRRIAKFWTENYPPYKMTAFDWTKVFHPENEGSTSLRNIGVNLRSYPVSNIRELSSGQYPPAQPDIWHLTLTDGQFQVSEWEEKERESRSCNVSNIEHAKWGNLWSGSDDNKGPERRDHLPPSCGLLAAKLRRKCTLKYSLW